MWADAIPKLLQARLIEGFENYDLAHAPLRNADLGQADYQMLIDIRRFRIALDPEPVAQIGLSVRLVDKKGTVIVSRLFEENEKLVKLDPPAAVAAFNAAFGRMARNVIAWTAQAL
jgi:phospholipid/cholesterol/gamma-HCH transport system substrate-binding protein